MHCRSLSPSFFLRTASIFSLNFLSFSSATQLYSSQYKTISHYAAGMASQTLQKPSILIVGCGLTGAATAHFIRNHFGEKVQIQIWEKARGAGGRMSTNRASDIPTVPFADMGAQYITKNISGQADEEIYAELIRENLIHPFKGTIAGLREGAENQENYICPAGFSSIVKHFAKGTECVFQRQLISISRYGGGTEGKEDESTRWEALAQDDEGPAVFDAVVLTLPVPQILQLQGDFSEFLEPIRPELEAVQYSSRWALAAYYPPEAWTVLANVEWSTKYVNGCEVLRYISIEQRKRDQARPEEITDCGPTLLLHTGVPFGIRTMDEDRGQIEHMMLEKAGDQIEGLAAFQPLRTKLIKWRYSQVYKEFSGSPGAILIGSTDSPSPLILSGDAFSASGFDSCVVAAKLASETLKDHLVLSDRNPSFSGDESKQCSSL